MPRQSVPRHFQRGAADHRGVCEKQPCLKAVVCEVQGRGLAETRTCRHGALHARNAERRHASARLEGSQGR